MDTKNQPVVESGMEILSWQYDPRQVTGAVVNQPVNDKAPALAGFLLMLVGAILHALALRGLGVVFALGGLALLFTSRELLDWWRRRRIPHEDMTRVSFTSTGVVIGPYARLWRGKREQLVDASVNEHDSTIELDFRGRLGRRSRMTIPVPTELKRAAIDVVGTLRAKIEGTTGTLDV